MSDELKTMRPPKTPMLNVFELVSPKMDDVKEFFDWLNQHGHGEQRVADLRLHDMLSEFFGLDEQQLVSERRLQLAYQQYVTDINKARYAYDDRMKSMGFAPRDPGPPENPYCWTDVVKTMEEAAGRLACDCSGSGVCQGECTRSTMDRAIAYVRKQLARKKD